MKKTLIILILSLTGCVTTAPNIKTVDDFKGRKLLVGRFIFYINGWRIEPREVLEYDDLLDSSEEEKGVEEEEKEYATGFSVYLDNGKRKILVLDEKGYVYLPVDEGNFYIKRLNHEGFQTHALSLSCYSSLNPTAINVKSSDTVVNFGTIKVELVQSAASQEAANLTFAATTAIAIASRGIVAPFAISIVDVRVTQTYDWDTPRKYILERFGNLSSSSIRDEIVKFPEVADR